MINLKEFFNDDAQKIGLSSMGIKIRSQNSSRPHSQKPLTPKSGQSTIKADFTPTSTLLQNSNNIKINFNQRIID